MPSYLYPLYDRPDSLLYGVSALGRVQGATGPATVSPLPSDPPHDETQAARYWAAVTSVAGARPHAAPAAAPARERGETVIAQRDTLRLHRISQQDNPFESLIEHVLHVNLHEDRAS